MKVKTSAAALGLVGGLALGVWIGSEMTSGGAAETPEPAVVATPVVEEPAASTVLVTTVSPSAIVSTGSCQPIVV